jgi:proteasome assembly chaperone (PAC2) family protein
VDDLVWEREPAAMPSILVVAFAGWFDAAFAATTAVDHLIDHTGASRLAHIDGERFIDAQQVRPQVTLEEGTTRRILWPENVVHATGGRATDTSPTGGESALVLISGVEPHYAWRDFAHLVIDVSERTTSTVIVTLGASASQTPHTRIPIVHASSTNPELATRFGLNRPRYQGITGILGVLHAEFDAQGIPAISMQVGVPHYATGTPNPKAALALLRNLEHVTGIPTGSAVLDDQVAEWEQMVDDAIAESPEAASYVPQLEARYDQEAAASIPSSDDLAAEFERYLRELDADG